MKFSSKKAILFGSILLILLTGVAVFVLQRELDVNAILAAFRQTNLLWMIPAVSCILLYTVLGSCNIRRGLRICGYRTTLLRSVRYSYTGFFFSAVTPSSSGGQPAQILYITRDGARVSHATFSILSETFCYASASVFLGALGTILSVMLGTLSIRNSLFWLSILGIAANGILVLILLCFMFSKKAAHFITDIAVAFCEKLLRMKHIRYRILRSVAEYRKMAALLKKNKHLLQKMLLTSVAQLLLYHSIPFFCCLALGCSHLSWLAIVSLQATLYISVSFLPLPGSAGVTEGGYALLFASLLSEAVLGSTMLLSRFISFILPLMISGLVVLISNIAFNLHIKHQNF